ncbi:MAG: outer membrane beta-barrel protein [Saprospiraceae bacterium]|nr:outer membrane beta-barrel protein [Saprospiraceae bacterium]
MKNIRFITAAIFAMAFSAINAQSGKFNISAGVGYDPTTTMDKAEVKTLPLTLKMGYQFSPLFSLNLVGGYTSTTSAPVLINDGLLVRTNMAQTFVGLRGELKKQMGDRMEVYGGATLGYVNQKRTETNAAGAVISREENTPTQHNPNAPNGRILYSGFVGTNFFVTKHFGAFAEVGYGVSLLNAGITARF